MSVYELIQQLTYFPADAEVSVKINSKTTMDISTVNTERRSIAGNRFGILLVIILFPAKKSVIVIMTVLFLLSVLFVRQSKSTSYPNESKVLYCFLLASITSL